MLYVLKVQCDQASLLSPSLMVAAKNTNTLKALSRVRAWFSCSGLLLKHDGATWRTPQKMTCSRCRHKRLILKQENTTLFFIQSHFRQLYTNKNITMPISWGFGSGVEPPSCYLRVAGSIPLVCLSNCPWARYWTPNCSWCAGQHLHGSHHHQCMYELL